ncbi:MAG: Ig-like domain repeat protein [Clostridia bacterium]|nr:Ig-like domain repeat protein [Clostridia bacterium]
MNNKNNLFKILIIGTMAFGVVVLLVFGTIFAKDAWDKSKTHNQGLNGNNEENALENENNNSNGNSTNNNQGNNDANVDQNTNTNSDPNTNVDTTNSVVDKVLPEVSVDIVSTDKFVRSIDVKIIAKDNVSVSKIYYAVSKDNTNKPTKFNSISLKNSVVSFPENGNNGEYYIWYYAVDTSNNACEVKVSGPYKIDDTAPSLSLSLEGTVNYVKSQDVNFSANDFYGISKLYYKVVPVELSKDSIEYIEVLGLSTTTISFPTIGNNGEYYIWYYAVDNNGNASPQTRSSSTYKIDNIAPNASLNVENTSSYVHSPTVNISASDNISNVAKIKYAVVPSSDLDEPSAYTEISNVNNANVDLSIGSYNGEYCVWYYAEDVAGNRSVAKKSTGTYKIDNTKSVVSLDVESTANYVTDVNVNISATDNLSDISIIKYKILPASITDGPTNYDEVINSTGASIDFAAITEDGEYVIWYYAVDSAGNISDINKSTGTYKIDKNDPEVSLSASQTDSYVTSLDVDIDANDVSGISKIYYKVVPKMTAESTINYTEAASVSSVTVSFPTAGDNGEYYIWYYAEDNNGNSSTPIRSNGTYKIDNTLPSVSLDLEETTSYVKNCDANIIATDATSSIAKLYYKVVPKMINESTINYTEVSDIDTVTINFPTVADNGEYYIWYYIEDLAGNSSVPTRSTGTYKIDNSLPSVSLSIEETSNYVASQSVVITGNEEVSDISKIYYKAVPKLVAENTVNYTEVSDTNSITVDFPTLGDDGEYYIWYYVVDTAGNSSTPARSTGTYKIDGVLPVVSLDVEQTATYVKSKDVVISASDINGISKIFYKAVPKLVAENTVNYTEVNGVNNTTINFPTLGDDGEYYLWYYAVDGNGNESTKTRSTGTYKIDNSNPDASIDVENTATYVNSLQITVEASDSVSSISKIMYKITSDGSTAPGSYDQVANVASPVIDFTGAEYDGEYYLWYYSEDEAGNKSAVNRSTGTYKIDNIAPEIDMDNYSINLMNNIIFYDEDSVIGVDGIFDNSTLNETVDDVNIKLYMEVKDMSNNVLLAKKQLYRDTESILVLFSDYSLDYIYLYDNVTGVTDGQQVKISLWVEDKAGNKDYYANNYVRGL